MNLIVLTHVYPANPHAPADIAGNFLPPFLYELTRLGGNVRVLAPQTREREVPDSLVPVTRFRWRHTPRPLGQFRVANPLDAARLASLISNGVHALNALDAAQPIDAVLACWAIPSGFIASYAKKPYAVWGLGTDIHTLARNPITRPFVKRALARASLRYANSHTLVSQIKSLGFDCDLLPNLRPLPSDAPPADFPHDRFNFLCAARLERVKGIDILLDALAQIAPPRPRVYIAGAGTLEAKVRAHAARLDLQNDVFFLGFLDERALVSVLRGCDALVIPSRDESIPMIFKEAARFGVPVVATDVGDLRIFVTEYNAGLVVPADDSQALARAMQEMVCAPREKYRRQLPDLAAQFDLGRSAEKLLSDLETVVT